MASSLLQHLVARISGAAMLADVRQICSFGPRWSGWEGEARARTYLVERLRAIGVPSVGVEEYPYLAYEPGPARVEVHQPVTTTLAAQPLIYAPSTPDGGLSAELFYGGEGSPPELRQRSAPGRSPVGQVVLAENLRSFLAYPWALAAGAAGFVLGSTAPGGLIRCGAVGLDRQIGAIPGVSIAREDCQRLIEWAAAGTVRVSLHVAARWFPARSGNVVATIPGRDPAASKFLVMAHLDSLWNGVHASDNASGMAMVLEMARLLTGAGLRRTVDIAVFGGEEMGFWGSKQYLENRPDEPQRLAAIISVDAPGSRRDTTEIGVTPDLEPLVRQVAAGMAFHPDPWSVPPRPVSDHIFFTAKGAPTVWIGGPDAFYHTAGDTPDGLNAGKLERETELALRVLLALPDSE